MYLKIWSATYLPVCLGFNVNGNVSMYYQCKKLGKIFTGLTYKLLLSFKVISDVYKSFIPNKTTFTKYCFTQWISKLPRSFEIHWVSQYLIIFTHLVGIVNATVYWDNFHRSRAWQIVLIFNDVLVYCGFWMWARQCLDPPTSCLPDAHLSWEALITVYISWQVELD